MPGPGSGIPEHEFQRQKRERQESSPSDPERLVAEGARVFAVVYRCIKDHTAILDEEAKELARAVADAHTTILRRRT
jgi:hypothetical protein